MNLKQIGLGVAFGAIVAVLLMEMFKPTPLPPAPRIITQRETVTVHEFDTLKVVRWLRANPVSPETTYLERVITAKPETLHTCAGLAGLTELRVGKLGDSTVATGFQMAEMAPGVTGVQGWFMQWYTPGALTGLTVTPTGVVNASWGKPPPICDFLCKAKLVILAAGAGALAVDIVKH